MSTSTPSRVDECVATIHKLHGNRRLVVFLDFDGTLAPIVNVPSAAAMSDEMRAAVAATSHKYPTAIISGRARPDVVSRVRLPNLYYAGSHGFDMDINGQHVEVDGIQPFLEDIAQAYTYFSETLASIQGCIVENNKFTLSVHDRMVTSDADCARIASVVRDYVSARSDRLKETQGKRVHEIRPRFDWNKGKAVLHLLEAMRKVYKENDLFALYIGDDRTDEDAYRELEQHGCGVGVLVTDSGSAPEWKTMARLQVQGVSEVQQLLERL
jgi:trehalose-phosphatase